jgi:hypothetical protein
LGGKWRNSNGPLSGPCPWPNDQSVHNAQRALAAAAAQPAHASRCSACTPGVVTAARCGSRAPVEIWGGAEQDEWGEGSPRCLGIDTAVGSSGAAVLRTNPVRWANLWRPDSDGRSRGRGKSLLGARFEWRGVEERLAVRRLWRPFLAVEGKRRGVRRRDV